LALSILGEAINTRWKILPAEQRNGIKNYIVNLVIKLSSDEATMAANKTYIPKLNNILVAIIKQEWPRNWENFIPELVASSRTSESLCENNMQILKLMSEEIFDYSSDQMTQAKIKELKATFNNDFSVVFELCQTVLIQSSNPSLLFVTLNTFLKFLNWIPLCYIFDDTQIIHTLIFKFFPAPPFRNVSLQCLTEIASLQVSQQYNPHFLKLFDGVMTQIANFLPIDADIAEAYANASEDEEKFIHNLAIFLTSFFKSHLSLLEVGEYQALLLAGMNYLTKITVIDDKELFKICLEYWNKLSGELYQQAPISSKDSSRSPGGLLLMPGSFNRSGRASLYAGILSKVRVALISNMAKPEEVIIVEDENGDLVKEVLKDSDAIILYKSMRETLVFLTHLDPDDTQNIMLEKLAKQVDRSEWSWGNLNTLCWAIGSISLAMSEEDEKRFLVTVIKDLLGMCEHTRGKDNKAVIASNIMYIVGQYPRFLRAHWKFLKTVVNKLFEFMHELFPGVQEMACDTFLKIAGSCASKFTQPQIAEAPFIEEIIENLRSIISELEPQQLQTFYEAVGHIISSITPDSPQKEILIANFMELPNQSWREIIMNSSHNVTYLRHSDTAKSIANILKTNVRAASSLGGCYISQLGRIFLDMLNVYKAYSEFISQSVAVEGEYATRKSEIRSMRSVKKETLNLIETFVQRASDPEVVAKTFVPPLLEAILGDYHTNIPPARDPEVLSVMAVIINKLKHHITPDVPRIFEAVFGCTLDMITKNFEDYPEHRLNFYKMLKAIITHCFQALFHVPESQFKLVVDSIVWGFKHTMRNIAESSLHVLQDLWTNIAPTPVAQPFYKTYFLTLMQDLFYVLTDTLHKSSFKYQATMLATMFSVVKSGQITVPLWDEATQNYPGNEEYTRDFIGNLLLSSFPNLNRAQVSKFVVGLFEHCADLPTFKVLLRDFLIELKEFASQDNSDLFLEEQELERVKMKQQQRAVPGLLPPSEAEMAD